VLIATVITLRSERKTALAMLKMQELQHIATELPAAFLAWSSILTKSFYAAPLAQWLSDEYDASMLVGHTRFRLSVNDDAIATEIDKASLGVEKWVRGLADANRVPDGTIDPLAVTERMPHSVAMTVTAATILVTANLPRRVPDAFEEQSRGRFARWRSRRAASGGG
jgi:hypothetical protein